ncbi:unnamed protein product [Caenorhabditis bovis]|uniref:DNA primase large subunit n=1 Tax=Caenorhabditis bovis TaxID=2654633 RepID=A0A8S1FAH9_9PELO|nr:unnamed protein product [Caenorhabditis bovis]
MIISQENRVQRSKIGDNRRSIKENSESIPQYLNLYQTPPGDEISLMEFDEIAMERLKLLKFFENCKDSCKFNDVDFRNKFHNHYKNLKKFLAFGKTDEEIAECWRRDLIGHCILRLAFCRTPENTKWFTTIETDLFRFRFMNENQKNVTAALHGMDLDVQKVSKEEKNEMCEDLANGCTMTLEDVNTTDFYKIDFINAIELVRRGGVHLKRGIAYFPYEDLISIVSAKFRSVMAGAMARSLKHLAILEEEGRLLPRLARLANNVYDEREYNNEEGAEKITRHMIDKLAVKSFPPCMKQMHSHLRVNHHLKYGARRQYGLFLKALGLSLDEAMQMMREEFTKKIPSDKFDKEYAYNIRYMYGKEGKRVPQNAMSCAQIILRNPPSAVDCHGCPFRHLETHVLEQKLRKDNLSKEQIEKIIDFSEHNGYDKACTRYFEFTHKMEEGELGQLITHPNQYFEESQKVILGRRTVIPGGSQSNVKSESLDNDAKMNVYIYISREAQRCGIELISEMKLRNDDANLLKIEADIKMSSNTLPGTIRDESALENSSRPSNWSDSSSPPPLLSPEEVNNEQFEASKLQAEKKERLVAPSVPKPNSIRHNNRNKSKAKLKKEAFDDRRRIEDPNAPKRPRSTYIQFLMLRRPHYSVPGRHQKDIHSLLVAEWQTLSQEQKKLYEEAAEKERREYEIAMEEYKKTEQYAEFQKKKLELKRGLKRKASESDDDCDKPLPNMEIYCPLLNSSSEPSTSANVSFTGQIFSKEFIAFNKARDSYRRKLTMERSNLEHELQALAEHDPQNRIEEQEKCIKLLNSKIEIIHKTIKSALSGVSAANGHLSSIESITELLTSISSLPLSNSSRKSIVDAISRAKVAKK